MNELRIFENPEFGSVRTLLIDDEPWFVGKDVAMILGYANSRKALSDHVDEDDKRDGVTIRDSIGRAQNPVCINESGLYSLIFGSQRPNAKKFKRWVTSEVLPAIRKTGTYSMVPASEKIAPAYDTKATSVGEVVNLIKLVRNSMRERGHTLRDIDATVSELLEQFNIRLPKSFSSDPAGITRHINKSYEIGYLESLAEEAKSLCELSYHGKKCTPVKEFNDFCSRHLISARFFRKWLYENGYISCSLENDETLKYSIVIRCGRDAFRVVQFN